MVAALGRPHEDPELHVAMRAIADGFRDELAPLQSRVVRAVVAASPGLATDVELERALELSVRVNLIDLLGRLADPALSAGVGVPPESLTFG
ncbi:MAG: hypothetical protein ACJ76K_02935, partial [Solirubrobacteraceae bacterium]